MNQSRAYWLIPIGLVVFGLAQGQDGIGVTAMGLCIGAVMLGVECLRRQREAKRLRALQLSHVDEMTGVEFEVYVSKLLMNQGFRSVAITGHSGDLGVDIVAHRNGSKIAVQVKRNARKVSRRAVSDVVAARGYYGAVGAMVVTNNWFTPGARTLVEVTGCELVGREQLTNWIMSFQGKLIRAS
jgi:restriction system protein